jgi:maltose O-acetyltransferase
MNILSKLTHWYRRSRLILDKGYYPEYLRKQGVRVGKDPVIVFPSYIDGRLPYLVEIGDNVVISRNVTILTHDATTAYAGDLIKVGRVKINDRCFIGANTTILCNVEIGENSIVGAGSVVNRDIPPNSVFGGNPAHLICKTEKFVKKHNEWKNDFPIIEGRNFESPYIAEEKKTWLKNELKTTFGYFCAQLPEK